MAAERTVVEKKDLIGDQRFTGGALQIAQGATWFGLGLAVGTALEYVTQALLAVYLGPSDFGLFNVGLRVTSIVTTLAVLALPNATTYFIPRYRQRGEHDKVGKLVQFSIWVSLLTSLLVGSLMFALAEPLALQLFQEPELTPVLRLFALTVPGTVLAAVLVGNLRGLKQSRQAALLSSGYERVLKLVFVAIFLGLGLGVQAPVLAFLVASVVVSALGLRALSSAGVTDGLSHLPRVPIQQLLVYTWPLLLSGLLGQAIPSTQPLLLARFDDARAVGLYSVASLIARIFTMALTAFNFLYIPVVAGVSGEGDVPRLRRLYRLVTKWQFIVILPTYLLVVSLPYAFLSLFGNQYGDAMWALVFLATSTVISVSFGPVGATLLGTGETAVYLLLNVAGTVFGFAFGLFLIPRFGLLGASMAHLLTNLGWNSITWLAVYRRYGLQPFSRQHLIVMGTAAVCLLPMYPIARMATELTAWALVGVVPLYSAAVLFIVVRWRLLDKDSQMVVDEFLALVRVRVDTLRQRLR